MKTRQMVWLFIAVMVVSGLLGGCAGPRITTRTWFEMAPATPSSQTKSDITIRVDYVGKTYDQISKFPVFSVSRKSLSEENKSSWTAITSADKQDNIWFNHQELTIFYITVINNTGHIIRMRDARIYAVIDAENYRAIASKEDIISLYDNQTDLLLEIADKTMNDRKLKLINGFNMEIMPGQQEKGFAFFEIDPEMFSEGTLNFYDITTKTDAAGNATEKTTFSYNIVKKSEVISQ